MYCSQFVVCGAYYTYDSWKKKEKTSRPPLLSEFIVVKNTSRGVAFIYAQQDVSFFLNLHTFFQMLLDV